jgi:hypothetical protein
VLEPGHTPYNALLCLEPAARHTAKKLIISYSPLFHILH